jgi:hypothetical protein
MYDLCVKIALDVGKFINRRTGSTHLQVKSLRLYVDKAAALGYLEDDRRGRLTFLPPRLCLSPLGCPLHLRPPCSLRRRDPLPSRC